MSHRHSKKLFGLTLADFLSALASVAFLVCVFHVSWFVSEHEQAARSAPPVIDPAFASLSLEANAIYVLDTKTGRALFSQNADAQLPLASLTKVMMAVTALSILPENAVVTIEPDFLKSEGDGGLFANERWKLKDLLGLTLLESSNDGASAIAAVAGAVAGSDITEELAARNFFVSRMNEQAKTLGLAQTYFLNPTGLDETTDVSGGYGSARDVAVLFSYALNTYPNLFGATRSKTVQFDSLSSFKHVVKNTNILVNDIPSLLGSKTGFTDLAGGNLVIAFDAGLNHPVVIAVLGSSEKGRFADVEKLVWASLKSLDGTDR